MQRLAITLIALCVLALSACRYPATEVMVAVDSDAPIVLGRGAVFVAIGIAVPLLYVTFSGGP
jgi:hypothetical protein